MFDAVRASQPPPGRSLRARLSPAVWLGFIALPLAAAYSDPRVGVLHLVVVGVVAATFSAVYLAYCALPDPIRTGVDRRLLVAVVAVLVAAISFLAFYDRSEWVYSYVYCLWPAIVVSGNRAWSVPVAAGLAVGVGALSGLGGMNLVSVAVVVLGVGAGVYGVTRLVEANEALRRAHADEAAAAVAEERLRFARDLHELLGHSLSVIALKSQVAARLVAARPERAATEMAEIEQITRQALHEVRDAVGGYRRPTLGSELEGARRALASAGVELSGTVTGTCLPASVETPLAWTLREAVTNVIRHAGASTCTVSLEVDSRAAVLTVTDDGVGPDSRRHAPAFAGNGLRGLSERIAAVGGTLKAGPGDAGGFQLCASLPLPSGASGTESPAAGSRPVTGVPR